MSFRSWLGRLLTGRGREPPKSLSVAMEQAKNQRRALALLEAHEQWWLERRDRFADELAAWERRLPLADSRELRGQVMVFIEALRCDVERADARLRRTRQDVEAAADRMMTTAANFIVLLREAEAWGFDVAGFALTMNEEELRAEAAEAVQRGIPEDVPNEARAFVAEIFNRRESTRRSALT